MKRIILFFIGSILGCLFGACSKPVPNHGIDVYLEAPTRSASFGSHQDIEMPASGMRAKVITMPILTIDSFTNVDLRLMDYPELGITAYPVLWMRVKKDAQVKLYQASSEAIADGAGEKRFFLVVDGVPIGYSRIWQPLRGDDLVFVIDSRKEGREQAEELEDLRFTLNDYILARREYMEKER